jgi:dihydrofolate reductase
MASMRRIIAYLAISADGYIARPDGDVEWLNRRPDTVDYGMKTFYASIDTILWGRKTYDWVLAYQARQGAKQDPFDDGVANYVFSSSPPAKHSPRVAFVTEPVRPFAQRLRARAGRNIWMMGGAGLIAAFLDAGELDEFDLHVIPTLIGEGIPLVAPRHRDVPLRLLSTESYPDGVVRVRYEVIRA